MGRTELVLQTIVLIQQIRRRLQTTQNRQKRYDDRRQSDLEFQVGDMLLLKVAPSKCVIRFRKRGKFFRWYIGPFQVISRVGKVAYRLDLHEELSQIHNPFHVLQLRKCILDGEVVVSFDDIQVNEHLNYVERPTGILERKMKVVRHKEIPLVKV